MLALRVTRGIVKKDGGKRGIELRGRRKRNKKRKLNRANIYSRD
jgi:hypothetical protein